MRVLRIIGLLVTAILALSLTPATAQEAPMGEDGATTESAKAKKPAMTGPELLELYSDAPKTELDEGFYYRDIYEGTGREPAKGHVVYVLARGYDANGAELRLGSDNHTHPGEEDSDHEHGIHEFAARWFVYGYGGGNLSMGTDAMSQRLFDAMAGMRENGKRLIYIAADKAYGETGYQGHDFKVQPNTDLLIELSLIRVRFVESPEDRGLY